MLLPDIHAKQGANPKEIKSPNKVELPSIQGRVDAVSGDVLARLKDQSSKDTLPKSQLMSEIKMLNDTQQLNQSSAFATKFSFSI